jgi:hypothetical protein
MDELAYGRDTEISNERGNQNNIYMEILNNLFSSINYRHIPIICINKRLCKFKVFDYDLKEWILTKNETDVIEYLKPYVSLVYSTLFEAVKNLRTDDDVNDDVIKEFYDYPSKDKCLCDISCYVFTNIINPFEDTKSYNKNEKSECELFKSKLINYLMDNFGMSKDFYTPPEEYDEEIDCEIDYEVDLDNVTYQPYHNNPHSKYVRRMNIWNYDD